MTTIKGVEYEIPVAVGMQQVLTPPAKKAHQQLVLKLPPPTPEAMQPQQNVPALGEPLELGVVTSSTLLPSETGESLLGDSGTWLNGPASAGSVSLSSLVSDSSSPSSELYCSLNSRSSLMSLFFGVRSLDDLLLQGTIQKIKRRGNRRR